MEKEDFIKAGFNEEKEDPEFAFSYSLKNEDEEYDNDGPALLFDYRQKSFCVTDGEIMFIYFNAENPAEAVQWALKITGFNPNF